MLSGRGLCDELITRPEESYRLCCVIVCDLETSRMGAPYIYDISRLRVNQDQDLYHVVIFSSSLEILETLHIVKFVCYCMCFLILAAINESLLDMAVFSINISSYHRWDCTGNCCLFHCNVSFTLATQ